MRFFSWCYPLAVLTQLPLAPAAISQVTTTNTSGAGSLAQAINAPGCVIRGLLLRNFGRTSNASQPGHDIWLQGAGGNKIERCWLGLTADGSAVARNNAPRKILPTSQAK